MSTMLRSTWGISNSSVDGRRGEATGTAYPTLLRGRRVAAFPFDSRTGRQQTTRLAAYGTKLAYQSSLGAVGLPVDPDPHKTRLSS